MKTNFSLAHRLVAYFSVFLLVAGLIIAISAQQTLYIAPGGKDENTGTKDSPFFTLTKAVGVMNAGDTLYVRGGKYSYNATTVIAGKRGSTTGRYFVLAYPGEKPQWDYATWKPAATDRGNARGILMDSTASWWYFKGIQISNAPDNGVKIEGAHNTFDQCVFDHNGDSGLQIGLTKDGLSTCADPENWAAYNTILNCDSYRNADIATEYENADGFACKCNAGKGNLFYGCRAWENCDDGWDCYDTKEEIFITNCWAWHNGDPRMWGFTEFNGDGNGFKLGGDGSNCPITTRFCISFNAVDGQLDGPGALHGFNDNTNKGKLIITNCVSWNCKYTFKVASPAPEVRNNIAFAPYKGEQYTFAKMNDQTIHDHNANYPGEPNSPVATASDFIDTSEASARASRETDGSLPKNGFGRLKPTSGLVDKGLDIGFPFSGAAPDLGAFEVGKELPTVPEGTFIIPNKVATGVVNKINTIIIRSVSLRSITDQNGITFTFKTMENSGTATINIYNTHGRKVTRLFNNAVNSNSTYSATLAKSDLVSGNYLCIAQVGKVKQSVMFVF